MAVGFAVDYSAHIAHGFVTADPALSRDARVSAALLELGVPVFQGGFSTMLAVCLIGFAKSKGFEVLFKMFAGLVGFGLLVGLVLLPVLLSLLPASATCGQTSTPMRDDVAAVDDERSRSREPAEAFNKAP